MQVDHITIEGKKYRVEVNWEAIELFEKTSGKTIGEFSEMARINRMPAHLLLTWAWCSLVAGAAKDDRKFLMDRKQLRRVFYGDTAKEFTDIFIRQYIGEKAYQALQKDVETKKKRKRWALFHRKK